MALETKQKVVILAGYRDWALNAIDRLTQQYDKCGFCHAKSPEELTLLIEEHRPCYIFLIGWSWILPAKYCDEFQIYGIHPSDLPAYAGGSPIQNQIIDGLLKSKVTLFRVKDEIDAGPPILKENLSLEGYLSDILENIADKTVSMISRIICKGVPKMEDPDYIKVAKNYNPKRRKRLTPEDSKLDKQDLLNFSSLELYNRIRAREQPYPNVYIEDEQGILFFERVSYEKKKK